jgi:hypothetical protein
MLVQDTATKDTSRHTATSGKIDRRVRLTDSYGPQPPPPRLSQILDLSLDAIHQGVIRIEFEA